MINFEHDPIGKIVSFSKYYNKDGRKSNTTGFIIVGEITAIVEAQTDDGILRVAIVTAKNLEFYYVLTENCTKVD